jgi:hypothetical protein
MASELLKVSLNAGVSNSESVLLNGVNGHTYTLLLVQLYLLLLVEDIL